MTYKKSTFRQDFDRRLKALKESCNKVNKKDVDAHVRDLVFQCSILQTSAAMETYIRLIIMTFFFNLQATGKVSDIPLKTRMWAISKRLERHFSNFKHNREEQRFLECLVGEAKIFDLTQQECLSWDDFDSSVIVQETTYPSGKNLKRILQRLGVDDPIRQANKLLKTDFEGLLTNFQSVRTALAHEAPPQITLLDTKERLADMSRVIRVLDRILHAHFSQIGGEACWNNLCQTSFT